MGSNAEYAVHKLHSEIADLKSKLDSMVESYGLLLRFASNVANNKILVGVIKGSFVGTCAEAELAKQKEKP